MVMQNNLTFVRAILLSPANFRNWLSMERNLFTELDQKINILLDELGSLRVEVSTLKEENQRLESERDQWHQKLGNLIQKFPEQK